MMMMMRVLMIILGKVGKLAIRVGDGRGRQFASGKNNKRTMKGSWSDLTAIAC